MRIIRSMVLTVGAIMSLVSCTNIADIDILDLNQERNWQENLGILLVDYQEQLSNSEVKIISAEIQNSFIPTQKAFFPTGEVSFPVYQKNEYNRFDPVSLHFLERDTTTVHTTVDYIHKRVNQIIENYEEYLFVKLVWDCSNLFTFRTIAVFDRESQEFVYDNVLGNIIEPSLINNKSLLTRSEINIIIEDEAPDYIAEAEARFMDTSIKINIKIKGTWQRRAVFNGDEVIGYMVDWIYNCADVTTTPNHQTLGTFTHHLFSDNCSNNHIRFDFLIWAGYSTFNYAGLSLRDFSHVDGSCTINDDDGQIVVGGTDMFVPRIDLMFNSEETETTAEETEAI